MESHPLYSKFELFASRRLLSTGALLEFGLEKMQKADFFSGYISVFPLIEHLMSSQKFPLMVLQNVHIN